MSIEFWNIIGYFASAFAGSGVSYIFTRNKYKQDVQSAKIDNFDKSIDAYKKMYEDMIGDLKTHNQDLVTHNQELVTQNQELIEQKKELKKEISELKNELNETRQQVMTLTNFVLASAIKRADGGEENILTPESIKVLKGIMKSKSNSKTE